jgi:phage-related protein (TIGR01555 family)
MTDPSQPQVITHSSVAVAQLRDGLARFNEAGREDSYVNLMTGLGLPGTAKSGATFFGAERLLRSTELQNLYQGNAYATRIVDKVVDDATRVEWSLTGTNKQFDWTSVKSQVDKLAGLSQIGDAWRWARLYGGGLVVMAVNDGRHFSQPLDLANAKSITGLSTLDSTNTLIQGWFAALGSVAWSEPSGYQPIIPWAGGGKVGALQSSNIIHPSRVIRFDGCRVPAALMVVNGGWSPSVLQRCKKQLTAYGSVYEYAQEIMHDLSVMLVKLEGFNDMTLGDQGIADARELLRQIKWGIDNLNLLVIDKKDAEYQEIKRSVEGFEKLILAFERDLVGASGMTRLILVGEQASGLGASSSDEVRSWYASVQNEQKFTVTPALNRLLEVIFACRRNTTGETVPSEWTVTYEPLWTPEPKAKAEIANIWANTVNTLIMSGTISPDQGLDILVRNGVLEAMPTDSKGLGIEPEPNDIEATAPTDEEEPTTSKDPIPADAMTPQEIAAALGVATIRVTRLVTQERVRLWNKLGKRVISLAEVHAVIEADNTTDAAPKADGEHSLTVSLRPPRSIAQWVPYNPDRPLPPHVTIVHCKDVRPIPAAAFIEALQELARASAPFLLTTGDVGYFDHDDQRVAFSTILGDIAGLYAKVLEIAAASGVECKTHESGYHPHMTLAQLPLGTEYTGAAPPVGSTWSADAIWIDYAGTSTFLFLSGNAAGSGEVTTS